MGVLATKRVIRGASPPCGTSAKHEMVSTTRVLPLGTLAITQVSWFPGIGNCTEQDAPKPLRAGPSVSANSGVELVLLKSAVTAPVIGSGVLAMVAVTAPETGRTLLVTCALTVPATGTVLETLTVPCTGRGVFVTLTGTEGGGSCAGVGLLVRNPRPAVTKPNPRPMRRILPNFFIVILLVSKFLLAPDFWRQMNRDLFGTRHQLGLQFSFWRSGTEGRLLGGTSARDTRLKSLRLQHKD